MLREIDNYFDILFSNSLDTENNAENLSLHDRHIFCAKF